MLSLDKLEQLATKLSQAVPGNAATDDVKRNFQAILQAGFGKLSLVTREEFDRQSEVLAKTRARLQELEARLSEWETKLRN